MDTTSHLAGRMMVEALQESFWGLRAFNFLADPDPLASLSHFRWAAHRYLAASRLYSGLVEDLSDTPFQPNSNLLACFDAAFTVWENLGKEVIVISLNSPEASYLRSGSTSLAALVRLARNTSDEAGQYLLDKTIDHQDSNWAAGSWPTSASFK